MNKIRAGLKKCDFVKHIILLIVVAIICLSSLCKRKPDENYLEPVNVSNNSGRSENPSIAVDSRNTVHLVWNDDTPGNEEIFYAIKPSNGSWSEPVQVTYNIGASRFPCIVIDRTDKIHLVWQQVVIEGNFSYWKILYTWRNINDTWAIPETISIYGLSTGPKLTIDDSNGLHLFWREAFTPTNVFMCYLHKPLGGNWQDSYSWSDTMLPNVYEIKVNNSGRVNIVWESFCEIYYIEKTSSGNGSNIIKISHSPTDWQLSFNPSMIIDNNQTIHIAWGEGDTALKGFAYVKRTTTGEWSPIVAPYKNTWDGDSWGIPCVSIIMGRSGRIYALWGSAKLGYGVKDGETWSEPKAIVKSTFASSQRSIAINSNEKIHFVWAYDRTEIYYIDFNP